MEQSGLLATSPGHLGQAEAKLQLAQAVATGKIEAYSYTSGIPAELIVGVLVWIVLGFLAVIIHRYFTHGPVNPFGEWVEIKGFWGLFIGGPFGFLVALYSAGDYLLEMHLIKRNLERETFLKNNPIPTILELFYSPNTGLPMERPVPVNKK